MDSHNLGVAMAPSLLEGIPMTFVVQQIDLQTGVQYFNQ